MSPGGVWAVPGGTLVDRTLGYLGAGPADSVTLATEVLGLSRVTRAIADRVVVALLGADPRVRQLADRRWSLVQTAARSPRLSACTYAVVDVETTGGRAGRGDRITEIGVATLSGGAAELVYERLVNPGRPIPRFVSRLTRITDAMVRDQPGFEEIADEVLGVLAGRVFVAHNARFDWAFLRAELERARALDLDGPRVCTVSLARRVLPGLRHVSLDRLAHYFGVEIERRHRAGGDALATARILARLLPLAEERGAVTVADLERLARRRRRRRTASPTSMDAL